MLKRFGFVSFCSILVLCALLMRIFSLSMGNNAAVEQVMLQSTSRIVVFRTKGLIYDRNLVPIAGKQPCKYLVVSPRGFDRSNLDLLLANCNVPKDKLLELLKKDKAFVIEADEFSASVDGVFVLEGYKRYSGVAQHLVGYLDGDGVVGLSGIEKEYDAFLSLFSTTNSIRYRSDAVRGIIGGLGMSYEEETASDNGVVLTLDSLLCKEIESIMKTVIPNGAVVVMDCNSWELLAVCSAPGYDESNISDHIKSDNGELLNRAFLPQPVGSVFKLVVAACALEGGLAEYRMRCDGGVWVGDRLFLCHDHQGHGEVDMKEALAQSCNSYFVSLGQLLGRDKIEDFACRIGYGDSVALAKSLSAQEGTFPTEKTSLSLANLSIGQGSLLASPLHITMMTALIANEGVKKPIKLESGLYLNGKIQETVIDGEEQLLAPEVAETLREYCVYAVDHGTGAAALPEAGGAGGKTSSAQTGVVKNGKELLNVCFTGFYPADNPRYAITVYAEDGISGGKTCAPVFKKICDYFNLKSGA